MTEEYNFKNICNIATDVMGLPKGSLADKSRKKHLQVTRAVAAYIGRKEEKVHRNIIAKVLNRDRTLIYHYEHSHKANYATFPFYRETFNKIYKAYINLEGEKNVFLLGSELKKYLLKNNVKETKNQDNEVLFEVVSGDASCLIKTTYFDFSNQFENIKLAMQNYHFKINII